MKTKRIHTGLYEVKREILVDGKKTLITFNIRHTNHGVEYNSWDISALEIDSGATIEEFNEAPTKRDAMQELEAITAYVTEIPFGSGTRNHWS